MATDLDGTLTKGGEDRVSPTIQKLLRKLKEKGWILILITGREKKYLEKRDDLKNIFDVWVVENGVEIYLPNKNFSQVYTTPEWMKFYNEVLKFPFVEPKKWSILFPPEKIGEIKALTEKLNVQAVFKQNKGVISVQPSGTDKGLGLIRTLKILNVDGWIVALGDSMVDLDMFKVANFKATVQDAEETVKKMADYVAEKPDGMGTIEILKKLLKEEF